MRNNFFLDAERFNDLDGFYITIYSLMNLYDDWQPAHNLDALNDMLYSGFGKGEVQLTWQHANKSRKDLGLSATKVFYKNKIEQGPPFNVEWARQKVAALEEGIGQTLFDIIVEIIQEHKNIDLVLMEDDQFLD